MSAHHNSRRMPAGLTRDLSRPAVERLHSCFSYAERNVKSHQSRLLQQIGSDLFPMAQSGDAHAVLMLHEPLQQSPFLVTDHRVSIRLSPLPSACKRSAATSPSRDQDGMGEMNGADNW